jgi:hypothetical protein
MQITRRTTKFIKLSITALLKTTLLLFSMGIIVVVAPHVNAFKDIFHADLSFINIIYKQVIFHILYLCMKCII